MDTVTRIVKHCLVRDIRYLTVYGFSIENWQRSDEVGHLMQLFERYATEKRDELRDNGVRVQIMGQFDRLPASLQTALQALTDATTANGRLILNLCLSYGGRDEIVRAAARAAAAGEALTEDAITRHLDSTDIPDPDLIIRTSGEQRLSNFLTWQSTYSELYFTPTLWPDFDEAEFDRALTWYAARERRRGA